MPAQLANLGKTMSKRRTSKAHRPVTRSMTASTKAKRVAALVKARAARGTKKQLSPIKSSGRSSSKKSKGGFFW